MDQDSRLPTLRDRDNGLLVYLGCSRFYLHSVAASTPNQTDTGQQAKGEKLVVENLQPLAQNDSIWVVLALEVDTLDMPVLPVGICTYVLFYPTFVPLT